MNKKAALTKKLLRIASENPESAKEALTKAAALVKQGHPVGATLHEGASKEAGAETADFAAWAIARGKVYKPSECERMLERLGVPYVAMEDKKPRRSGPLQVGETVRCNKNMLQNEQNADVCERFHKQLGQVEQVERGAVVVRFDGGQLARFEGQNRPGKELGIGRATRPSVVTQRTRGKALVEVIYISDKNAKAPSKAQKAEVVEYVEKGELQGDKRHRCYYSGLVLKHSEGKNGYYFTVFSQSRDRFPRSFNPSKGKVFYIGRLGGRPGGWREEYASMMAEIEASLDDGRD